MNSISLIGSDTIVVGGRVLTDFGEGDVATLTFPNEIMNVKTGKNGNSIFALNNTGLQCDVSLRILRGSDDDKVLNGIIADLLNDPASFVVLDGQFVKRVGDGTGVVTNDTYIVGGGVPTRQVGAAENADGNTDPAIAIYEFKFTNTRRAIL
jgi:hypothetical protein